MTYKELYEKLKEFAKDKEYGSDEVDVSLDYSSTSHFKVEAVTVDGYIVITQNKEK